MANNFLPEFTTQKLSFRIIGVNRFGETPSGQNDSFCPLPRIEIPLQDFFLARGGETGMRKAAYVVHVDKKRYKSQERISLTDKAYDKC